MAGHSKLPWKVSKASPDGKELFVRGDDVTIVACRHRLPYPLSNANMKFIVLACNSHDALLNACMAVVQEIEDDFIDPDECSPAWRALEQQCRAAIALATPAASKEIGT